jgi:hypothetical protein
MKYLIIFCFSILGFSLQAQTLLWQKTYPFRRASGTPYSMVLNQNGDVFTHNSSDPLLVDTANNNVLSCSLLRFSKSGDSLSFDVKLPGILQNYYQIRTLSDGNIVALGLMRQRPFFYGENHLDYWTAFIFDSTGRIPRKVIPFNKYIYTATIGNVGGILPGRNGSFWIYGTRDDSIVRDHYKPYLFLFDSSGRQIYDREYSDSGFCNVRSMVKHPNGNLVMFGTRLIRTLRGTQTYNVGKCFIMEVDTLGNLIGRRYFDLDNRPGSTFTIDGSYNPLLYGTIHPDGSFLLFGNNDFGTLRDSSGFITKLDTNLTTTHWLRRLDPLFKLRVLADGSSFIAGYLDSRIRGRYMFLRRYDNNGSLFQDFRLSGVQGTLPTGPYAFYRGNYEFASDSSVIFVGDVINQAYTNILPYLFIAKIGGYPNPYNPLALPLDRRMMEETYVYPNPFQDQFTLATKSGATEAGQLYLFNLLGQQVYQGPYTTSEPMRTPPIKPGIYLWRFVGKGVYSGRLVRE